MHRKPQFLTELPEAGLLASLHSLQQAPSVLLSRQACIRTVHRNFPDSSCRKPGPKAGRKTTFRVFSKSWFNVFSIKTKTSNTWCLYQNKLGYERKEPVRRGMWGMGTFLCHQSYPEGARGPQGPAGPIGDHEGKPLLILTCCRVRHQRDPSEVSCPLAMRNKGLLPQCGLSQDLSHRSDACGSRVPLDMYHRF